MFLLQQPAENLLIPKTLECGGEGIIYISSTSPCSVGCVGVFLAVSPCCQYSDSKLLSWQQPELFEECFEISEKRIFLCGSVNPVVSNFTELYLKKIINNKKPEKDVKCSHPQPCKSVVTRVGHQMVAIFQYCKTTTVLQLTNTKQ